MFCARRIAFVVSLLGLIGSGLAFGGTTGQLAGTVSNPEGQPLAGAKITATSPSLLGDPPVAATAADGGFLFPALPPGLYSVTIELAGFVTQEIQELRVQLDRTTDVAVALSVGEFAAGVEVVADAVQIDPRRVSLTDNFTNDYLENAAVGAAGRTFQTVLPHAAGVTDQSRDVADFAASGLPAPGNPNVFGSTVAENAYYVDGMENTDVVTGTFSQNFNFDAIEEISFLKGGFEAEYGFASGGFVNLITKSGGNQVAATFDLRYSDDSLSESGDFFDSDEQDSELLRPAATIGGAAVVDRLWYFVSAEHVGSEVKPPFTETPRDFSGEDFIGKLTWEVDPGWQLVAKVFGEDTEIENPNFQDSSPETQITQEQKAANGQLTVVGSLSANLLWDAAVGVQDGEINSVPSSGDFATPGRRDFSDGTTSGNVFNGAFDDRDRKLFKTSFTFLAEASGLHEAKLGLEYQDRGRDSRAVPTGDGFFFADNLCCDFVGRPFRGLAVTTSAGSLENESTLSTLFLQDAWDASSRITLKAGLRLDEVDYENNVDRTVADMDRLQPRVGLAAQLTSDGRTVARASWGQYLDPAAMFLAGLGNDRSSALTDGYFSCTDLFGPFGATASTCDDFARSVGFSGATIADPFGEDPLGWFLDEPAQPFTPVRIGDDVDPAYSEQLILSVERQLTSQSLLEVFYVDKETEDIYDDTCSGNLVTPSPGASCAFKQVSNLAPLTREYEAIGLVLRSRLGGRANLLGSYTWSESKGSIENTQASGADFDVFPDFFENRFGLLSDHRLHRVKLNGYVTLPLDFVIGLDGFWSSDLHWTPITGNGEFLESRGNREGGENYQIDLQVAKGFRTGEVRTSLIASIYNLLDDERVTQVCQFESCLRGGEPVDQGDPTSWQQPRRYEFGVRVEFR